MAPAGKKNGAINNDLDSLTRLGRDRINKSDIFGRALIHLAASIGNVGIVNALLDNIHLDLSVCDSENHWTALHRALEEGNIAVAQLIWQREQAMAGDRTKQLPIELLNQIIGLVDIAEYKGATELFTFGSNANHSLGFADSDDRANPARVKLSRNIRDGMTLRQRIQLLVIDDAAISKLHSAVVADGRLYVCGVARGGRLGLGSSTSTQFSFTPVSIEKNEKVVAVALGMDHTVAVTSNGSVYTWGLNQSAQLGYITDEVQTVPRRVFGSNDLRKAHITHCSASRIHTVVYNSKEMYCWGVNIGQLGYTSTPDPKVGANVVQGGGITEIHPRKVVVSHGIIQAIATDVATIVLFDNDEVRVFMNGGNFRVGLPNPATDRFREFDRFRARNLNVSPRVVQIAASSNGTCCMLTNSGTVLQFYLEKLVGSEELSMTQLSKQIKVHTVWRGQTDQMRARHVDCGDDGSIIICVENGSVWKRRKTKRGTVVERVPLVNRIHRVRCDSNFGSFMALRQDLELEPVGVPRPELASDLETCMSFASDLTSLRKAKQLLRAPLPIMEPHRFEFLSRAAELYENDDDEEEEEEEEDRGEGDDDTGEYILAGLSQKVKEQITERDDYDTTFEGEKFKFGVHSSIINARVPNFTSNNLAQVETGRVKFEKEVHVESAILVCYYLYTDKLIPIWTSIGYTNKEVMAIRDQAVELAGRWHLDALRNALVRRQPKPHPTLHTSNLATYSPDIKVKLLDGSLKAHRFVLATRCSYFEALFSDRWTQSAQSAQSVVSFGHVTKQTFAIILEFLYTDKDSTLFDSDVSISSSKQFINLVMEVLAVADELSIMRLKAVCESAVCSFVSVKNCGMLLAQGVKYRATQLCDRVLYYICYNMDCLLENNFLYDLDHDLFEMVDLYMKMIMQKAWRMPESVFWRAFYDPVWHDELTTRRVPKVGVGIGLQLRKRRQSSFNAEKPVLVSSSSSPIPQPQPQPEPEPVVITPTRPAKPVVSTPEAVKIGDLFKEQTTPEKQSVDKPKVIEAPKLSQKERRRQQKEKEKEKEKVEPVVSSSSSSPWAGSTTPAAAVTSSPFDELKEMKKRGKQRQNSDYTLQEIIQQEKRTVQKRQEEKSRSLKEIQQQEEFEKWFEEEAKRVQNQAPEFNPQAASFTPKPQRTTRVGGKRGKKHN